jgi:hypothetical protein
MRRRGAENVDGRMGSVGRRANEKLQKFSYPGYIFCVQTSSAELVS